MTLLVYRTGIYSKAYVGDGFRDSGYHFRAMNRSRV